MSALTGISQHQPSCGTTRLMLGKAGLSGGGKEVRKTKVACK